MGNTPHKEKLMAAIANPKCAPDLTILKEAEKAYHKWVERLGAISSIGKQKVLEMTNVLNEYKDYLEVDLIARKGSSFIKRQKGQLKLDNSIIEEFLIRLIDPSIIKGLPSFDLEIGPHTAFMSLSFRPSNIAQLDHRPEVVLKLKDQDFAIGKAIHYKFSSSPDFADKKTTNGSLFLSVLSAECKVNLDKTMFQECAGTASRLKLGSPVSKYYVLAEYLDMQPEDCRLTEIANVFLLRHAKRLPADKRPIFEEVRDQHKDSPIDPEVILRFVMEIQNFIGAAWYDPHEALKRGSFN